MDYIIFEEPITLYKALNRLIAGVQAIIDHITFETSRICPPFMIWETKQPKNN